LLEFFED